MKPTDFPPFPEADQAQTFSIRATDLRRMVAQTVIAAAKENGHYAKAAVLFRTTPGQLELVATHRWSASADLECRRAGPRHWRSA
jgi:DNA polymerase III sliding clamp (beta) subunit (PCNA family)